MLQDFVPILIQAVIAIGFAVATLIASVLLGKRATRNRMKDSAYECGFEAFGDARIPFDIRFYLVAILFIIFDLEVSFLFPWALTLNKITFFGFWSMVLFLIILKVL